MEQLHQPLHRDDAGLHKFSIQQRERRFQSYNAHCAFFQSAAFFLGTVRGMVRGDHVDGAVCQAFQQRLPVSLIAQRRIHFETAVLLQAGVIQQQVVRTGLTGDVQTLGLGLADQVHALLGGDVADVIAAARLPHQLQIPLNGPPLALGADAPVAVGLGIGAVMDIAAPQKGIVLAVGHDQLAQALGLQHGAAHHVAVLNALSVIGEGHHTGGHGVQVRQLPALLAFRNRPIGQDPDHGVLLYGVQLRLQGLHAVRYRIQVRHGAYGGIAAVGRR